jgi:hypothetical protein
MTALPVIPLATPLDWYWTASDGQRIYSSARNALVYPYDTAYLAFVAAHGTPPWPIDANGQQTTAAMQAVMSQYGITLAI